MLRTFLKILHYVTSPFDFHYHVHHDYMLLFYDID